jgi:hypothetical protein
MERSLWVSMFQDREALMHNPSKGKDFVDEKPERPGTQPERATTRRCGSGVFSAQTQPKIASSTYLSLTVAVGKGYTARRDARAGAAAHKKKLSLSGEFYE